MNGYCQKYSVVENPCQKPQIHMQPPPFFLVLDQLVEQLNETFSKTFQSIREIINSYCQKISVLEPPPPPPTRSLEYICNPPPLLLYSPRPRSAGWKTKWNFFYNVQLNPLNHELQYKPEIFCGGPPTPVRRPEYICPHPLPLHSARSACWTIIWNFS